MKGRYRRAELAGESRKESSEALYALEDRVSPMTHRSGTSISKPKHENTNSHDILRSDLSYG
jgi:hypothetical protein